MPLRIQNGGNHVELAAPTLTGNVDLTLPNGVGTANQVLRNSGTAGELEFATLAVGQNNVVVNVEQQIIDSTAQLASGSANTFVRFAAMDVTYTTTVAGSIFVSFNWSLLNGGATSDTAIKLFRRIGAGAATELLVNPSPLASTNTGVFGNFRGTTPNEGDRFVYSFLDTPGHTAGDVITYEHHFAAQSTTTLNVPRQTNGFTATCVSPVVFMEVAP
tara:strand:- start:237 stop:887 length:651 start_codon:yes stop_codon:yes gene_type:complete